ncbi:LrgB family protein, partial [Pseudomonas viridiflava]|uniref:LrgB family protein n=1 Tax=Pseudomonas viridiflava TaxID=33069 RepID=UPI0013E05976
LLLAVAVPMNTAYAEYSADTHWLMLVLGPVTVASAVPIWQQRMLLARYWPALLLGMIAGSVASIATSFGLAKALALDSSVTMSLVPRSITTPFAMPVSSDLGGVPE